jgi:hypothetical protein
LTFAVYKLVQVLLVPELWLLERFSLGCMASVHGKRLPARESCGGSQTGAWEPL